MPAEHVAHVGFLKVMHMHIVASCFMTFFTFSRRNRPKRERPQHFQEKHFSWSCQLKNEFLSNQSFVSLLVKQHFYLTPHFSGFIGIIVMTRQRDFRSINCSYAVNEKFHQYFHWHMDPNIWKTSRTAV